MIVEVVEHARAHGAREVSLNFAGMRRVLDSRRPAARAGALLLRLLDRWVDVRPLNRFSAKFQPRWRPRSLLLSSWWQLGWVAAASLRAELGPAPVAAAPAGTAGSPAGAAGDIDGLAGDERGVVAR